MAIEFNVDAALAKLEALAVQHGPQAIEVATQVVRVNAVGSLVSAIIGCSVGGVGMFAIAKLWGLWKANDEKEYLKQSTFIEVFGIFGLIAVSGFTTIVAAISLLSLLDVWMWVGIFQPKLALAHEILAKVAGQ